LTDIGLLVLEKIFFFNMNMAFPIVAPPNTWGLWFEQTWIYVISEILHVNMNSSSSVVIEKKVFIRPHPNIAYLWLSPLWRGPGPYLIPFTQGWFVQSLIEIGLLVLEKILFSI
jgi:hypothetical protein